MRDCEGERFQSVWMVGVGWETFGRGCERVIAHEMVEGLS